MTKTTCDACGSSDIYTLYTLDRIPAFQNKLFPTIVAAEQAAVAGVVLAACPACGFVFNASFDNDLMDYDDGYQNAQDHSPQFQSYLDGIADLILQKMRGDRIVEIGCGKGFFLNVLRSRGIDIVGFDPTYEGEDPSIIKEYFNAATAVDVHADAIVMRHTLEHIESPWDFLKGLKSIVPPDTRIFIEVPRFEWIVEHKAFWDVFHEHCNYFSETFFQQVFAGKADITKVFDAQYMLVSARLGDLADRPSGVVQNKYPALFAGEVESYGRVLHQQGRHVVWGAGAKGVAFANILDPQRRYIEAIVDIHPRKQGTFCPLTGHPVVAPGAVEWGSLRAEDSLWIMNALYKNEILASLPPLSCQVRILGE